MNPLSIRNKIWLTIISVSVMTILLVVVVSYYLYQTLYIEKQTDTLINQGRLLEEVYYESPQEDFSERLEWIELSSETSIIFSNDPMQLASGAPFDSFAEENLISFSEGIIKRGDTDFYEISYWVGSGDTGSRHSVKPF
jgi:hypothetical protein